MIRIFMTFFGLFFSFYFVVPMVRKMNGLERWNLVKLVAYSALCAVLSISAMILFVFLF